MKKSASFVLQKSLFFALLLLISISTFGQKKLVIVVDGMEELKGSLMIAVYNSDTTFLKKPAFVAKRAIHSDTEKVKLDLPEGEYAVSLFQDVNDNGKLDRKEFGIPIEKYGFSNNAKGRMGPPTFEKAKFGLSKNTVIRIRIQ